MDMQSLWSDNLKKVVRQFKTLGTSELQNKLGDRQFNLSLALSANEKQALFASLDEPVVKPEGRSSGYWG